MPGTWHRSEVLVLLSDDIAIISKWKTGSNFDEMRLPCYGGPGRSVKMVDSSSNELRESTKFSP